MIVDRDPLLRYGAEELQRQQVVVAYNRHDAFLKGLELKGKDNRTFEIPGDGAGGALDWLLRKWKGFDTTWVELAGKRVLDIAAGSASYTESGVWYPHFSRFCAINGADVVALDIRPQAGIDQTLFTSAEVDLVEAVLDGDLQNLPVLKGKEFDIIHSANFIGWNHLPQLSDYLAGRRVNMEDYSRSLHDQASALLAEDGIMTLGARDDYRPVYYVRQGSSLVELDSRP